MDERPNVHDPAEPEGQEAEANPLRSEPNRRVSAWVRYEICGFCSQAANHAWTNDRTYTTRPNPRAKRPRPIPSDLSRTAELALGYDTKYVASVLKPLTTHGRTTERTRPGRTRGPRGRGQSPPI